MTPQDRGEIIPHAKHREIANSHMDGSATYISQCLYLQMYMQIYLRMLCICIISLYNAQHIRCHACPVIGHACVAQTFLTGDFTTHGRSENAKKRGPF